MNITKIYKIHKNQLNLYDIDEKQINQLFVVYLLDKWHIEKNKIIKFLYFLIILELKSYGKYKPKRQIKKRKRRHYLGYGGRVKKEKGTNRRSARNFQKFYANGAFQN